MATFVPRSSRRPLAPAALAFSMTLTTIASAALAADVDEAGSLREAFGKGEVRLALRYRLEHVEDDGAPREALASTLRTALRLSTARWQGVRILLEAENVAVLGDEQGYRNAGAGSLSNGVTDRAVVADPEGTEVQQAFLEWVDEGDRTTVRAGRQEIDLGDQRFVGTVGWRQNHQSFDALRVDAKLGGVVALTGILFDNVNRIFGDDARLDGQAVWVPVRVGPVGTLTGYGLFLDFDDAPESSSRTVGLELVGAADLGGAAGRLSWELELAEQRDHGDRAMPLDAGYLHAAAGIGTKTLGGKVGYEVLEGKPGAGAFTTPLATLHKFNGWADRFLATPAHGLEDLYLGASGTLGTLGWTLVAHEFRSESDSIDYGRELDAQLTWTSPQAVTWGFKAALYDAEEHSADVTKLMLWAATTF